MKNEKVVKENVVDVTKDKEKEKVDVTTKRYFPAWMLKTAPRSVSAVRRFPPGCGRVPIEDPKKESEEKEDDEEKVGVSGAKD